MQLTGTNMLSRILKENEENNILISGGDTAIQRYFLLRHFNKIQEKNYFHILIDATRGMENIELCRQYNLPVRYTIPGKKKYYCRLFDSENLVFINRMRMILDACGYEEKDMQRIMTYIHFLQHIDSLQNGDLTPINEKLIIRYSTSSRVQCAIQKMADEEIISQKEHMNLLELYSELSSGGADIEKVLLLEAYISTFNNDAGICIEGMQAGETLYLKLDKVKDSLLCELLLCMINWDIEDAMENGKRVAVTIIEQYGDWKKQTVKFIRELPEGIYCAFFSKDFFAGNNNIDMKERFPVAIYTRHDNMNSCEKIEELLGKIPVVKNTYTVDKDRRIANNSLLDRLFNTNKTEHYTDTAPIFEPKFLKERIYSFPEGVGIIDYKGENSYFHI